MVWNPVPALRSGSVPAHGLILSRRVCDCYLLRRLCCKQGCAAELVPDRTGPLAQFWLRLGRGGHCETGQRPGPSSATMHLSRGNIRIVRRVASLLFDPLSSGRQCISTRHRLHSHWFLRAIQCLGTPTQAAAPQCPSAGLSAAEEPGIGSQICKYKVHWPTVNVTSSSHQIIGK
ncbi:hypothetical protein GJAV_G00141590 [Gymnothorax javanicus]|nr:hypothetical protein GJAV_G00141590 [Gymnothorax javanicus]